MQNTCTGKINKGFSTEPYGEPHERSEWDGKLAENGIFGFCFPAPVLFLII